MEVKEKPAIEQLRLGSNFKIDRVKDDGRKGTGTNMQVWLPEDDRKFIEEYNKRSGGKSLSGFIRKAVAQRIERLRSVGE